MNAQLVAVERRIVMLEHYRNMGMKAIILIAGVLAYAHLAGIGPLHLVIHDAVALLIATFALNVGVLYYHLKYGRQIENDTV